MLLETDTTLLDPGWREAVHDVGGVLLHVVEAGKPGDPVVVLLHGFPEFWWGWRHQMTALAETGRHVVVPDLRGYNLSEAPDDGVASYHLDVLVQDVVGLVDGLVGAPGDAQVDLVGHDWGAMIGWRIAAQHPERLRRFVAMAGPHPDLLLRSALSSPLQPFRSAYAGLFQLPWLPESVLRAAGFTALRRALRSTSEPGTFTDADLDRYAEAWARPGSLTAMLDYYRALRLPRPALAAVRVTCPTLVLWGENDAFLDTRVGEAALAQCTDARLVVLDGATHWLHHEQPERVNDEVLGFLDGGG
ncbi:alpha/beta fold hydrolase [Knoellia sp. CPCC 206450]|uniref:alpha/beta fold hydrolase n=1 Tax=Knoellia tibetensis TaxID=3404798 RepID=UPI003B42BAE4